MLEPRETDIPALFLVFVVLPLVAYFLLGKWSESTKQKERISLLAQQAAEEALRVEVMAAASVIPVLPLPNSSTHQCARCFGPTSTRCKRCKSVWYCSGKCQIIHWREVHKHQCQQVDNPCSNSSPKLSLDSECHVRVSSDGRSDLQSSEGNFNLPVVDKAPVERTSRPSAGFLPSEGAAGKKVETSATPLSKRRSMDKRLFHKSNEGTLDRVDEPLSDGFNQESAGSVSCSPYNALIEDDSAREKLRENNSPRNHEVNISSGSNIQTANTRNSQEEGHMLPKQSKGAVNARKTLGISSSPNNEMSFGNTHSNSFNGENLMKRDSTCEEDRNASSITQRVSTKRSNKNKSASGSLASKHHQSPKPTMKLSREETCSDPNKKAVTAYDSKTSRTKDAVPAQGSNPISTLGIMKMIGLMKPSKLDGQEISKINIERHKKVKMLFPYEDFVKYFHYEVCNIYPRGLVNCGNSCYANAVLQCLSCTKPLILFLLRRSHSRSCCAKDWCLMCELEQHVMMLREGGGPLSPSRILSHIRTINSQIGDGSQEDAHEFLRFLVASMQAICLEGLGGENIVDPRLQETTFIQHTFGGRLRSKVKCLRCHHESQRTENIMDLTLEIFGWVESLEDALTQFTNPEDLDGENMYRCGRCAAYVRARKQLSIQEAPNILTIVLKRFQEGSYGKINKCITFPDILDMVPYMTGTDDVPPLYVLYAVVVHLDTLNASFSGHYISYIKDLQGSWFRIDDTEVQPVEMSQVMSEGAYILFYMRSSPRPSRVGTRKTTCQQTSMMSKHCSTRTQKPSAAEQSRSYHRTVEPDNNWATGYHSSSGLRSATVNRLLVETYTQSTSAEFSDVTSSDWSLFTSSDESSFTTESTRDSFSTVDYSDANNIDPFSSIFGNMYTSGYHPSQKSLAGDMFSTSKPQTRFFSEEKGSVVEYFVPPQPPQTRLLKAKNSKRVSLCNKAFETHGMHVNYGNDSRTVPFQTL